MCGIAGYFQINEPAPPDRDLIRRMLAAVRHRGPDELGVYLDDRCVLGQARLSIIDLTGGSQPLCNEDGSIWITFNGEIFNYIELQRELESLGHKFRTRSDTEVIVHAYERWGRDCMSHFNGQFAFALYDKRKGSLLLTRDRVGIRPLFYTTWHHRFLFASEIKALLCHPQIPRRIDLKGLDEIFTWWTTAPPRTAFEGINELEAGTWLEVSNGRTSEGRYWQMTFPEQFDRKRPLAEWAEALRELLIDAVRLRLRADVPVGAYLSGGLDSSTTTALVKRFTRTELETFSIAFHDKAYDESEYQRQMASYLHTDHHQIRCGYRDIATSFPAVIQHTERPLVRTAPTPLFLLSELVSKNNFKVVLTGEGADEILAGYDLFKEVLIRTFWARSPDSSWRPALLRKLYPTLPISGARARLYLETFYKTGLSETDKYYFSHLPRINTTTKIKDFLTPEAKHLIGQHDSLSVFATELPDGFFRWHHLLRAQYLEARSLLSGYLLSSQGDRVAAAHAVETRYPFLDHRVMEFAATIPPWYKLRGLNEKFVLKKAMLPQLPPAILNRVKQPYMAPDSNSFVQEDSPAWISDVLSEGTLKQAGLFNPKFVARLHEKCRRLSHAHMSFKDNMSLIGILSTQLLVRQFVDEFQIPDPLPVDLFTVWQEE